MNRNIKILMHTHWDREWYFTKSETQVLLRNHMFEVIEFLEENTDVIYILDGQSVMLDDFIEFAPKWKERVKALVERKALRVGPWYTQTDLMLVHGESIIRNLYYGMKKAMEYGDVMKVGYAPDTFGHSAQIPQIYKQFGIESTFFWRGFSELKADKSDFLWKGIDGSVIFGINLATGYQGAKYLESDKDELKSRMEKIMKVLDKYSAGDSRLIMNGHDQMPIQKDIHAVMDNIREFYPDAEVSIADFESYVDSLKDLTLETVEGDLNHSKHARIHKTITSTRMDIKLLNTELEYKIYNILEPLALLGKNLNIDYPHEIFEKCLKEMFGTHAHDSIGGCNSDLVNKDIKQRLIQVKEIVDTQIELYMRLISLSAEKKGKNVITLYNYLPYERKNETVEVEFVTRTSDFKVLNGEKEIDYLVLSQNVEDAGLIDRQVAARLLDIKVFRTKAVLNVESIKGLSVEYLTFEEGVSYELINNVAADTSIENDFYKVTIENNGIKLLVKGTGEVVEDVFSIETSGDAGDSYDYSPPHKDIIFASKDSTITNIESLKGNTQEILKYRVSYNLPQDQASRDLGKQDKEIFFDVTLTLDNSDMIKVDLEHTNSLKDTRFRAVLNTNIKTETVECDSHLSVIENPVYFEKELSIWEEDKWAEKPVSIETFNSYVALEKDEKRATIFSYGLKEYEVLDKKIFVTLFRSFSHLGKRELINRPGRPSGIEIETPDNQLIGEKFKFSLAASFVKNNKNDSIKAKEFLTPIAGYQLKEFNRFNINVPKVKTIIESELSLDLKGCVVSTLKESTQSENIFIRLFNPTNSEIQLDFSKETYMSNMFEEKLEKIEKYTIKGQEILNILV
ncbi:glycoside hydrolase family 38 N-terminal domain-containing protein [Candidatus Cetobacterium colombiensis]|uniref:Glycoside hydrolase family 38 C-terminal domain-containing protein n=1 Tax=Candidatus Cetobacterium colombiensis TaxID=3073100 RepID=A0ABU4WCC3_9FUSO|nr:glycosyl hydrolase-related protein [Candidatus Cetobacterium colombiensis]MDX8336025.1 glycoside hydrolase family 38 C-terminal domain-containing protein [Candidatus Cetobacterium colombiensis]